MGFGVSVPFQAILCHIVQSLVLITTKFENRKVGRY